MSEEEEFFGLTKNFKLKEFRCRDGSDVPEDLMGNVRLLAENLQVLRDHIGKPIRIISGYRSKKYNTKINGAKRSQHMLAKAADIKISTFVHYDVRGWNARWKGSGVKDDIK